VIGTLYSKQKLEKQLKSKLSIKASQPTRMAVPRLKMLGGLDVTSERQKATG